MKIWKLVSGILSIVMSIMVLFQSCAASMADALEDEGGASGGFGILVTVLMLTGGIVSIAVRRGEKGGNVALIIIFGLAAFLGIVGSSAGSFGDLAVWGSWCLICAILAIVSLIKGSKKKEDKKPPIEEVDVK